MQYDPSFVACRSILSGEEKAHLRQLARQYSLERFKNDARNYEEMAVDFVYTSAKIEGNTYDRLDTDNLLRLGITAGGKRYFDAVMLLNLREGFSKAMESTPDTNLDLNYVCDLHQVLMKDLLPKYEQGIVRTSAVKIGGSDYKPLADPVRLRAEMAYILNEANKYPDAFDRAIYLHCNLAYLQYFHDGNKRTARLMQTAALVQSGVLPLFFHDSLIEQYQRAIVHYYETGQYGPYVDFFKDNYALTINGLLNEQMQALDAHEAEEFARRVAALSELRHSAGPEYTFWQLAQNAIQAQGGAERVNWAKVERQTIVECLGEHGQSPQEVGQALCRYSPGACSEARQQGILEDIQRLTPDLQEQYQRQSDFSPQLSSFPKPD